MKNRVEVVIAGNRFTMTGEQDEEYMTKIAALVDNRVCKIRENGANMMQALMLAACDMADNYVQAVQGAENSRNFVSKFGRAKSYGAKTIGTPDAGAKSMAKFFAGLAK